MGRRLDSLHDHLDGSDDPVAHWMMFDSSQPPSRPHQTFRDTRQDGSIHPPKVSDNSRGRHGRSALWFARTRRGGGSILHHRHIRPVLIRDWSPKMDGIASHHLGQPDHELDLAAAATSNVTLGPEL